MAAEADGFEEQNSAAEPLITEKENINEEENVGNELNDGENDNLSKPDPPNESDISQDDSEAESTEKGLNWPMHERCVHGEINEIWVPFDKSEVYSRLAEPYELPYELPPFGDYIFCEWSEVEHLLMTAIEFAEEEYNGDRSSCPSPTGMGL
ncbi:uncharacterized protein LOC120636642 [Pararge aegeria]|uniref:Jg294 protein n=1 Tax=Pararge aegeria aegeria TaxID=348720 RepID=A0A8S4QXU2_9NEOP|nr:uncharacterized protein LOC120636642 [Pararge aegeria]XP_039764140.1 uncharacterized protein LOC120636642 [Pararge aegeria]CAH2221708.1 jg294 [Pararge aegeria aegeria]